MHKFYRKSFLKYFLPIIIYICFSLLSICLQDGPSIDFLIPMLCSSLLIVAIILEFYWPARKKENNNFSQMMKKKVLQNLLSVFGDIKWIEHDICKENLEDVLLTDKQLNESGLFVYYNTRFTDDEFEGIYKGVPFNLCFS